MKYLLLVIALFLLVASVSGTTVNFQNPTDFYTKVHAVNATELTGGTCTGNIIWVESSTSDNNYIDGSGHRVSGGDTCYNMIYLPNGLPMTYSAARLYLEHGSSFNHPAVRLLAANGAALQSYSFPATQIGSWYRYEVKINGGIPKYYRDGVLMSTGSAIATNPYYIGWGQENSAGGTIYSVYVDDIVWGDAENTEVLGLPESDDEMFVIQEDPVVPANNGVAFGINGTPVQSTYLIGQYSVGNKTVDGDLINRTINLINVQTGYIYAQNYSGAAYSGTIRINVSDVIAQGAPDGLYATTVQGTTVYSNYIWKKSQGAIVTWDRDTYSPDDTGVILTYILTGGYWDISTYSYKLSVVDAFGGFHGSNQSIDAQSGSFTYDWQESDSPGVYYAAVFATNRATGKEYVFGIDTATLTANANYYGYVIDAESELPIPNAIINMTQGLVICNTSSGANGNYSCNGFYTGVTVYRNTTAAGYQQEQFNWTPVATKSSPVNISMLLLNPTHTGIALGGIVRDKTYGAPIPFASVEVSNYTHGQYFKMLTNLYGFYRVDADNATYNATIPLPETVQSSGCRGCTVINTGANGTGTMSPVATGILIKDRLYLVTASRIGYGNVSYKKVVTGS